MLWNGKGKISLSNQKIKAFHISVTLVTSWKTTPESTEIRTSEQKCTVNTVLAMEMTLSKMSSRRQNIVQNKSIILSSWCLAV